MGERRSVVLAKASTKLLEKLDDLQTFGHAGFKESPQERTGEKDTMIVCVLTDYNLDALNLYSFSLSRFCHAFTCPCVA